MAPATRPTRLPAAAAAALLLAALVAVARPAAACRVTNADVSLSSSPAELSSTAYTAVRLARTDAARLACSSLRLDRAAPSAEAPHPSRAPAQPSGAAAAALKLFFLAFQAPSQRV
jgi:hypothetical protein